MTETEEFTFDNSLESFQDVSHASEKILISLYSMDIQTFLRTAYAWKIHHLLFPINISNAELRVLYKAIIHINKFLLLLTFLGIPTIKPTKAYEDNNSVIHTISSRQITPRLRHVDIPIYYLHHKKGNILFECQSIPSQIQFANMGTKPESRLHLICLSSIAIGHVHIRDLL